MDIDTAKALFDLLQFLLTGGIGIYVYLARKNSVTNERINSLEHHVDIKLDNHSDRISTLEGHTSKSPSHADLAELHEKINRVGENVREIAGEFSGVRNLLGVIHDHLLNQRTKQ